MKTAMDWALAASGSDGSTGDLQPLFALAMADARRVALEAVLERMNRFASGHHFAGDLAGEKSFRRCIDEVRALLEPAAVR